jgi:hypothetical protein
LQKLFLILKILGYPSPHIWNLFHIFELLQVLVELFKYGIVFLTREILDWDAIRVLYNEILYLVIDYYYIS